MRFLFGFRGVRFLGFKFFRFLGSYKQTLQTSVKPQNRKTEDVKDCPKLCQTRCKCLSTIQPPSFSLRSRPP